VLLKADCTLEATSACTSISPCVYYRNVLRVVKLCIICTVWYISVHQQSIVSVSSRFHFGSAHRSMGSQVASTRRIDTPLRATHGLRSAGGAHGRGTRVNITGTFFAAGSRGGKTLATPSAPCVLRGVTSPAPHTWRCCVTRQKYSLDEVTVARRGKMTTRWVALLFGARFQCDVQ